MESRSRSRLKLSKSDVIALIEWKTTDSKLLSQWRVSAMFRGLVAPPPTSSEAFKALKQKVERNKAGRTALDIARQKGRGEIVQLLKGSA